MAVGAEIFETKKQQMDNRRAIKKQQRGNKRATDEQHWKITL
jgi:hypothetical protein